MAHSIICERAFEFAVRVLKLSEELWRRGPIGRRVASQLMGCGTSIGSNAEEAQDAQTKPDYVKFDEVAWELGEAGELLAMIISAIKTAQSSPSRGS